MAKPLLRLAALLLIGAGAAPPTAGAAPPEASAGPGGFFELKEIGKGVFAAVDGPQGRSGSNAGFVIGEDGVAVIDSFFNPEATRALVAEIRRRTDKPIRFVINTHYHVDHTAGDGVLKAEGAVIIARPQVRAWLHEGNLHLLGRALTPERRALVEGLTPPDVGVAGPATLWLGSRRVELRPADGHTGGDLVVTVPDAKAVFCGDLFWRNIPPNTIDGRLAVWIADLKDLENAPDAGAEVFVPGHGGLGRVADLRAARGYLEALRGEVEAGRAQGLSGAALRARVLDRLRPAYGAYEAFDVMTPREVADAEAEAAGVKALPPPPRP